MTKSSLLLKVSPLPASDTAPCYPTFVSIAHCDADDMQDIDKILEGFSSLFLTQQSLSV